MRIGILTLPFHSNFGYLMQAYALQTIIKRMGHQPYTIYMKEEPIPYRYQVLNAIKRTIKNIFFKTDYTLFPYYPTENDYLYKDINTWDFIKNNLNLSPYINLRTKDGIEKICGYDAYIVGSDQVWRREYSGDIPFYFFDFLKNGQKRMSYAASFGNSNPSYSPFLIRKCKLLLKSFDIVTVRENDGIAICQQFFEKEVQQVLDPTLLLSMADYEILINKEEQDWPKEKYVFSYILDSNSEKDRIINKIAEDSGCIIYNLLPKKLEDVGKSHIKECIFPPISKWLQAFAKAEYVITDSFHGTVFSILFNKQFSVFCNYKRGASRIKSLLEDFDLESRMIANGIIPIGIINYELVECKLQEKISDSMEILKSFLTNEK